MKPPTSRRKRQTMAAGGLQSRQTQTCLPGDLTDQLPSCSFSCILDFARQNYSPIDCAATSSIDFLCTRQTRSGTTIGEASLQCVASNCTNQATNEILLAAYNICEDVDGALPNTATVVNATIRPVTPTTSSTTPATAAPPAQSPSVLTTPASPSVTGLMAGGDGSRVISGEGMSVTMDIMMPSTTTTGASPPTMTDMRSNFMPEEMNNMNPRLSTPAIAGIATGSGVAALLLLALLFLLLRRRKQAKEDKVWPKQISSPDTENSQGTSFGPTRPKQYPTQKRRSFWRVSIMPEEIGIAVSGKPGNRKSTSSEKSMLGQMSTSIPEEHMPSRSSWPAPVSMNPFVPVRPPRDSVATIFDEDIEQQPTQPPQLSVGGAFFALAEPAKPKRLNTPQPLKLNRNGAISPSVLSSASTSIPLTPTYDNGNFVVTPNQMVAPNSIDAALASTIPLSTQGQRSIWLPNSASPDTSPRRNRLQKKSSLKQPPPTAPMGPTRSDSMSTTFETDTTPEEVVETRLEMRGRGPLSTIVQSPRTPITELRYPTIPESAAVSPQARNQAQPRYLLRSPSPSFLPRGIRPKRDTLFRNDSSFTNTDSTSSDGRESEYSFDWPIPPSGRPPVGDIRPGITAPVSPLAKIENCAAAESNYTQQRATEAQLSPDSQARITPTKSKTGDLFFKVEMQ